MISERGFYTPYGWKGEQYEQTRHLDLKDIAFRIKKEILAKHPDIKVSVKTDHYSMGCSIDIYVTSYPDKILYRMMDQQFKDKYGDLPFDQVPKWVWSYRTLPKALELLEDIQRIANQYRYDDSDSQIDYFSTNFHCVPEFSYELRRKEEIELGCI
jgi:hypothetical protein